MRKIVILMAVLLCITVALVPIETTLVPKWRVRVVDQYGRPVTGVDVAQFCRNYSLDLSPCMDAPDHLMTSDELGYVEFPERKVSMAVFFRLVRTATAYVSLLAHGSVGSDIYLQATSAQGVKHLKYDSGTDLPAEFVLPSNEKPGK